MSFSNTVGSCILSAFQTCIAGDLPKIDSVVAETSERIELACAHSSTKTELTVIRTKDGMVYLRQQHKGIGGCSGMSSEKSKDGDSKKKKKNKKENKTSESIAVTAVT